MKKITIINAGMGNVGSIKNILKKLGASVLLSSNPEEIGQAEKLILPGVGSYDAGMNKLTQMGLLPVLEKRVLGDKIPILGICLGMQLMAQTSEEGRLNGLGWIKANAKRFKFNAVNLNFKVPHMCWNTVIQQKHSKLFRNLDKCRFYFVHSYHVECMDRDDVLTTTCYGYEFVSSFEKDNIIGVQFHPEKSHKYGFSILRNFLENY